MAITKLSLRGNAGFEKKNFSNTSYVIIPTETVEDPSGDFMSSIYKWNQMENEQGVRASKLLLSLVYDFSDFSVAKG